MAGTEGNGERHNAQKLSGARFPEKVLCQKSSIFIQEESGGDGKPQSQEKPHAQNLSCALRTSGPIFPGDEAGNGDLGPGGGQRITDSVNGKNHLIDADALGTDGAA